MSILTSITSKQHEWKNKALHPDLDHKLIIHKLSDRSIAYQAMSPSIVLKYFLEQYHNLIVPALFCSKYSDEIFETYELFRDYHMSYPRVLSNCESIPIVTFDNRDDVYNVFKFTNIEEIVNKAKQSFESDIEKFKIEYEFIKLEEKYHRLIDESDQNVVVHNVRDSPIGLNVSINNPMYRKIVKDHPTIFSDMYEKFHHFMDLIYEGSLNKDERVLRINMKTKQVIVEKYFLKGFDLVYNMNVIYDI